MNVAGGLREPVASIRPKKGMETDSIPTVATPRAIQRPMDDLLHKDATGGRAEPALSSLFTLVCLTLRPYSQMLSRPESPCLTWPGVIVPPYEIGG
jgi:hypothetical protein